MNLMQKMLLLMGGQGASAYSSALALDFDGVDDFVTFGTPATLNNITVAGFTASAWINPRSDGENSNGRIMDKDSTGAGGWFIRLQNEVAGASAIVFHQAFTTTSGLWVTDSTQAVNNTWTHVLLTYDASLATNDPILYVNGSPVTLTEVTTPVGTAVEDSPIAYVVGNRTGSTNVTFDGLIDEIFIADRILTAGEVTEAYNDGSPLDLSTASFADDLISWWKMGDGDTYPTLLDSIGSNNGTMTNMAAGDIVAREN